MVIAFAFGVVVALPIAIAIPIVRRARGAEAQRAHAPATYGANATGYPAGQNVAYGSDILYADTSD